MITVDLYKLTLDVFLLTEAFLGVAVAGSITGLDPIPQASFMTSDYTPLFRDRWNMVIVTARIIVFLELYASHLYISGIKSKASLSYLYSLAGILTYLCFQLHHKSYLDMSAGQGSRSSTFQIFLEREQKEKPKWKKH